MHGDTPAIEQTRLGKQHAAVLDAADFHAKLRQPLQPSDDAPVADGLMCIKARQYEYGLARRSKLKSAVGGDDAAIAGAYRASVAGDELPSEQRRLGNPVGDEKRLGCRRQAEIREFRAQQEGDVVQTALRRNAASLQKSTS
jgi:hypothetical protein